MKVLLALLLFAGTAIADPKTDITAILDDEVAPPSSTQLYPAIPTGKVVRITKFGCMAVGSGYAALQWGSGSTWETVRACSGNNEFFIGREYIGDGAKRFRVVRVNASPANQLIVTWVEGFH